MQYSSWDTVRRKATNKNLSDLTVDIETFLAQRSKHYGHWTREQVSRDLTRLMAIAGKYPLIRKRGCIPPSDIFAHEPWKRYSATNNCYAFALDDISAWPRFKLMPGPMWRELDLTNCDDIKRRVAEDERFKRRGVTPIDSDAECAPGYYKISMYLAPKEDFHFMRIFNHTFYPINKDTDINDVARKYKVPVGFIRAVNQLPSDHLKPATTPMILVPFVHLVIHKRGHAPDGPTLLDACDKENTDLRGNCGNYGFGINYS